jgi:heme o synthase
MNPHSSSLDAQAAAQSPSSQVLPGVSIADLVALAKPRITVVVVTTTVAGLLMASPHATPALLGAVVLGTLLIVGGANALNMYLERDSDRLMKRTSTRPLPAGRMLPWVALLFGVLLSVAALPVLFVGATPAAVLLAAIANVSYVLLYTPLKPRSWLAVWVGAVPGAIPPLLGWAAATGRVDLAGLSLFAIMFFWQIPHFHAIALFRREEYTRAGLQVLPEVKGEATTRRHIVLWTAVLVATTFAPYALGMTSAAYPVSAALLGAPFLGYALVGLRGDGGVTWARRFFGVSIPYLVLLFAALLATRIS